MPPLPASIGPIWSPDSRFLLFNGSAPGKPYDWWVAPLEGGAPVPTGGERSFRELGLMRIACVWTREGVIFGAGTAVEGINLFRASFGGNWRLPGPAVRLSSGTSVLAPSTPACDGRLLVSSLTGVSNHWILPLPAAPEQRRPFTREGLLKYAASLSRDGSRLAYAAITSFAARRGEVRVSDLTSARNGLPRQLISGPAGAQRRRLPCRLSRYLGGQADLLCRRGGRRRAPAYL